MASPGPREKVLLTKIILTTDGIKVCVKEDVVPWGGTTQGKTKLLPERLPTLMAPSPSCTPWFPLDPITLLTSVYRKPPHMDQYLH